MPTPLTENNVIYDLISVCNDSRQFFQLAAEEIDNTELSLLYSDMAEIRGEIAKNLLKRLRKAGTEPTEGGALSGEMRTAYTHLRDSIFQNPSYLYLSRLEEPEGKALDALTGGVKGIEDAKLAQELSEYLRIIKRSHNRMRVLRETSRYRPLDESTTH